MPTTDLQPPARIVRPRNRTYKRLPVIAISNDMTLTEDGQLGTLTELQRALPTLRSTLFAKRSAADYVAELDAHFSEWHGDTWQWRATTNERNLVRPDGMVMASRITTLVYYFGFKGGSYHKIIDPVSMYGHSFDTVWPDGDGPLMRLLEWAVAIRDFCHDNAIEVRPTIGGMSGQFLTDRRFYPERRRKVPMATNERARDASPGNHYILTVTPSPAREFTAHYLDQRRAHHYHARTTPLPDSNQLYAYGRFTDLAHISFRDTLPNFYGLYCLALNPPTAYRRSQWIRNCDRVFVFSNELQHLYDMGYTVRGVYAAWGSHWRDTGLARYACWAEQQLDRYEDAPWIKPLLLATYGTLATRATYGETVFKLAKQGEPVELLTGHRRLSGKLIRSPKKLEPRIANVLHRGMIEAATRSESIGLAQYLTAKRFRVLSIYADAVIVEADADKPLPILIEPWRLKRTLNHLQFVNQQAFISGEMTKLPGVGHQELRDYQQHAPGSAPRKIMYEALTGRPVYTDRRI